MTSSHRNLHPALLAQIDQRRAKTREDVDNLSAKFREHADTVHGGDLICSHALTACTLFLDRQPIDLAVLVAGALTRIVELERERERLNDTITRYQTAEQQRADRHA